MKATTFLLLSTTLLTQQSLAQSTTAASSEDVQELPQYVVQGFDESSYGSRESSTATRIPVENRELPLLVNVISEHLLDEQQIASPEEAFKNISSVHAKSASSGQSNQVAIRGFNSFTYIDGFRLGNSNSSGLGAVSFSTEAANIERIEVLKGPAATLYGRGLPGGVINYITKKPQLEQHNELTAQAGSDDFYRLIADSTGAIAHSETMSYRIVSAFKTADSHRDHVEVESANLYPSFHWQISEQASLLIQTEYQDIDYTPDQGSVFLTNGSEAPASSESFFYGDSQDDIDLEQFGINTQFEVQPTDFYTFRTLLGYRHFEQEGVETLGVFVDGDALERVHNHIDETREDYTAQLDHIFEFEHALFGEFELGHQLLITGNYDYNRIQPESYQTDADRINLSTGALDGPSSSAGPPNDFEFKSTDYGIGIQDLIAINDRLNLLLGFRYDYSKLDLDLDISSFSFEDAVSDTNTAHRAGIIYELSDTVSVFANYGTSYRPSFRINNLGQSLFEIQESEQYEIGIKANLLDEQLTLNVALFDLTNKDVVIVDQLDSPQTTDQDSYGLDLDLTAKLTNRTTLLFNYALVETEYTDDPFDGNELYGTPKHSGGVWISHALIQDPNETLSLSLGANYQSSTYATDANNIKLPSAVTFDAGVLYKLKQWQFRANLYNLTDKKYYVASPNSDIVSASSPIFALPAAPRSVRISASYIF